MTTDADPRTPTAATTPIPLPPASGRPRADPAPTGPDDRFGAQTVARTGGPAAAPADHRADGPHPTRRRGTRLPARVRIMAWLVLLMTAGLASVLILVSRFEYRAIEERVNRGLAQDAREFHNFAAAGVDPTTDRVITDAAGLFDRYLTVQSPDRAEILLGVTDLGTALSTVQVSAESVPAGVVTDEVVRAVVAAPENVGTVPTSAGELWWIRTEVLAPLAERDSEADAWFIGGYLIDDARAEADGSVRTLALLCGLALLVGAGVSWLVAGQILAPVRTVRRAAAELTEDDLTRRIPVQGRDDIAALAEQFNAMLDRLEQAFGTRRQFLDDAGHELRTPITIVRGHLELMGDDPADREETVRLCLDELDRMARIVDDMLLLAKAEQPDFVTPALTSVPDLTTDIDAKIRALADRSWSLDAIGEGEADLDAHRVTQAVVQLAQNAVQHTDPGAVITLGSAVTEETVLFWVSDTGPGVPPGEVDHIFERFARGRTADGDRRGAGLGLAIVKAIADGHRGRVWVQSEPGRGATFGMELPLLSAPAAPSAAAGVTGGTAG